jgi:hypothetical protein
MHFAAVDIGSPAKGNLGWWVYGPAIDRGSTSTSDLLDALEEAITDGPVVLGFEAPMYVPAKREALNLLKSRPGEGSRPWSVAAGATTTAIALAVVPWLLDELSRRVPGIRAWQDWREAPSTVREMLVFEAFVSGGPSDGHAADAKAAAVAAEAAFAGGAAFVSALSEEPCFSLLGAALLHAGMSSDLGELHRPCMVIKAAKTVSAPTIWVSMPPEGGSS